MRTLLPDISLRQLEYLVAVVDAPTWAVAAANVGVSPSALSQGLAELERRVGVALFESSGRRRVLRDEAAPVLEHARRVVALTGDLVAWAGRVRGGNAGRIRLGLIDVAAVVHYPDVLRAFRRERPDVELRVSVAPSASLLDALGDGDLDLVVCVEPPEPRPGIEAIGARSEALHVIAPPGAEIADPARWGPWLLFPTGSHTRHLVERALVDRRAPIVIAAESHQPDVLLQLASIGLGWTVLPVPPRHVRVSVGPELATRRLVVARRSESIRSAALDLLASRLD